MILLTGATGFLGGHVLTALAHRRERLRLIVRNARKFWCEVPATSEVVLGSLEDFHHFPEWLKGIETVVHVAAVVRQFAPWREFQAVNVDATRRLAESARLAGVRRFIYISTVLILGSNEKEPEASKLVLQPSQLSTAYQRSKSMGLEVFREQQQAGLPSTVLFPGILFGRGPASEGNFIGKLMHDYFAGRAVLPRGDHHREPIWSFAAASAVAAAVATVINDVAPQGDYILAGHNLPPSQFFHAAAEVAHASGKLYYVPRRFVQAVAAVDVLRAVVTRSAPLATPGAVRTLARDWAFSSQRAERDLRYSVPAIRDSLSEMLHAAGTMPVRSDDAVRE